MYQNIVDTEKQRYTPQGRDPEPVNGYATETSARAYEEDRRKIQDEEDRRKANDEEGHRLKMIAELRHELEQEKKRLDAIQAEQAQIEQKREQERKHGEEIEAVAYSSTASAIYTRRFLLWRLVSETDVDAQMTIAQTLLGWEHSSLGT